MDRKKTILIAVMVNAGLLVVLFVAALTSPEEASRSRIAEGSITAMNEPLFSEKVPQKISAPIEVQAPPFQEIAMPKPIVEQKQEVVTHRLPPPEEPKETPKPLEKVYSASAAVEVTVKKGDSLAKIAKAHNTSVEEIVKHNQLQGSFLKIGQVLKLPEKKSAVSKQAPIPAFEEKAESSPVYYTVKSGDNPWGIAVKHHMKMEELLKLNQLNEEKARRLKPGDRLRIR